MIYEEIADASTQGMWQNPGGSGIISHVDDYRNELHNRINANPHYSPEYSDKLKELFEVFAGQGYVVREHALGRVLGQKKSKGKREFTVEEVLTMLSFPPNYTQDGRKWVRYYNQIVIIQDMITLDIITINSYEKPTPDWREIR